MSPPPLRRGALDRGALARRELTRRELLRGAGVTAAAVALGTTASACGIALQGGNQSFSVETVSYGTEPMQTADLTMPLLNTPRPVIVLIHGGYWRVGFTREEMSDLALSLARAGYASWNIDYRRIGDPGGGWSGTLQDVADAVDKLDEMAAKKKLDLTRVAFIGHSAGAELAYWAATRNRLAGAPGANPKLLPKAIVSLAGVLDLNASGPNTNADLTGSITTFLGGTAAQFPDRYAESSPTALLPLSLPQLLLHGTKDDRVPIEQSRTFKAAADAAGDKIKLIELDNIDHFDVVKSSKGWWDQTLGWLATILGDPNS